MTDEDCVVITNTLWERAADIVCDPDSRLAFHAAFVASALGGFRPGCLMRLPYRQVAVALVRDPLNPKRIVPVVTISIRRNKLKYTMSVRRDDL
jgi:hypothetical protein